MRDYFDLIARRESCRDFADRPVEREKLEKMVEAARLAPSACNGQPWRYTVVTRPDGVQAVAECAAGGGMNRFAKNCPAFIVVEERKTNFAARAGGLVKRQPFAQVDLGLSVMQLVLAATAQGLDTCILGWFSEKRLRHVLGIREDRVRLIMCVGYAAQPAPRPKKRKPLSEIARFVDG